jgi:hypothetical protein
MSLKVKRQIGEKRREVFMLIVTNFVLGWTVCVKFV